MMYRLRKLENEKHRTRKRKTSNISSISMTTRWSVYVTFLLRFSLEILSVFFFEKIWLKKSKIYKGFWNHRCSSKSKKITTMHRFSSLTNNIAHNDDNNIEFTKPTVYVLYALYMYVLCTIDYRHKLRTCVHTR